MRSWPLSRSSLVEEGRAGGENAGWRRCRLSSSGSGRDPGVLQSGDDCRPYSPAHVNQGLYRQRLRGGALAATGGERPHINILVGPTTNAASVDFYRRPAAARLPARVSAIEAAPVRMMQDYGRTCGEFSDGRRKASLPELLCAGDNRRPPRHDALIEPTGGISLDNFGIIANLHGSRRCRASCHVYSSLSIRKPAIRAPNVIRLMEIVKALV